VQESLLLAATAVTLLLPGGPAYANSVVIEHVTLIDGTHAPHADMTVAVAGERITAVTPTTLALKGRHIDARGKYLIPGLIDVHIHLRGGFDPTPTLDTEPGPPHRHEGWPQRESRRSM
jgi:imidazolonepropionase-like amidohydrolase